MAGDPKECCRRSLFDSIKDTLGRVVEDKSPAPNDVANSRLSICRDCEHITPKEFCSICHCYLPLKTKFANMRCPLPEPKWTEYEHPTN